MQQSELNAVADCVWGEGMWYYDAENPKYEERHGLGRNFEVDLVIHITFYSIIGEIGCTVYPFERKRTLSFSVSLRLLSGKVG